MKKILMIEDNPGDVLLFKKALEKEEVSVYLEVRENWEGVRDFLTDANPDFIVLDLNLPQQSGWEILEKIKDSFATKKIPIVIFTSSDAPIDSEKAKNFGVDLFLKKPNLIGEYRAIVLKIFNLFGSSKNRFI